MNITLIFGLHVHFLLIHFTEEDFNFCKIGGLELVCFFLFLYYCCPNLML